MDFYTRYTPPPSPSVEFKQASMTDRSFREECDINTIVRRAVTQGLPQPEKEAVYADLANMPKDLQESYEYMQRAEEQFMSLPSELRRDFGNDPIALISAIHSGTHRELFIQHGLITQKSTPDVQSPGVAVEVSSQETNVSNSETGNAK